ncbi:MAG: S41 family peptidase [Bdellovibrionales bacterium]
MIKFLRGSVIVLAITALTAQARDLTTEQKLRDFHLFTSVIANGYGPLEYKMANKIVDLSTLDGRFESKIAATTTNRDFYYTMVQYVAAYKDGHFHMQLPTKETAKIEVVTDLIDGKVLITKIDREKVKEDKFPFAVGDEIVKVDGQPIGEYLDWASTYIGSGNEHSVRKFAAWSVFSRRYSRMPGPTKKTLTVEVRRGTSQVIDSAELEWTIEGKSFDESEPLPLPALKPFAASGFGAKAYNYDLLKNDSFQDFIHPSADRDFACSGKTRIEKPKDATTIMDEPFVAYYHPTAKGNIGYLRIPHYYPQAEKGENPTEVALAWMAQYEFAIRELEKNTVGLIIDQDHNCGGSVSIVNQTISMFMDRPFVPSQFELLATKESYLDFKKWEEQVPKHSLDLEKIERVLKLIEDTWKQGTSFLTPKTSISGEGDIAPAAIHYTKPVVVLIDEVAGSGGDMFPAMMQGLGRAKLFGQTTSGLGGHVQNYPAALPYSQLQFTLTKSLFYRPDGVAIENNGAVPDQTYTITREDVMYGYRQYQKAYLEYLFQQL